MATIMISVGDISELIEAFSAAAFVFYMLVFIAVLIMRVTHRNQPRLFKVHLTVRDKCLFKVHLTVRDKCEHKI